MPHSWGSCEALSTTRLNPPSTLLSAFVPGCCGFLRLVAGLHHSRALALGAMWAPPWVRSNTLHKHIWAVGSKGKMART